MKWFPGSYAAADRLFEDRYAGKGTLLHVDHPFPGPGLERLRTSAVLLGEASATKLAVVISGTHGVEGFIGSAAQLAMADEIGSQLGDDTAILLIHAMNPWGFAHCRRVDQDNVDVNRNFVDFNALAPENRAYEDIRHLVCAPVADLQAYNDYARGLHEWLRSSDQSHAQQVLSGGQYIDPKGLFFGGLRPSWSRVTYEHILRQYDLAPELVVVLDIHAGLGEWGGLQTILVTGDLQTASRLSSDPVQITDSRSSSIQGALAAYDVPFPHAAGNLVGLVLEIGTYSPLQMLWPLQEEACLTIADSPDQFGSRARLRAMFAPEDPEWRVQGVNKLRKTIKSVISKLALDQGPSKEENRHAGNIEDI